VAKKDDKLEAYRGKRHAGRTHEPFGATPPSPSGGEGGWFVVQMHAARRLHWDLRLEIDGVLRSWAVPRGFSSDPQAKRLAVQTEDHPIEYVDYEGVIPDGNYGAGGMIVWDRGIWTPLEPVEAGYAAGKLLFELRGHKLRGVWTLVRTKELDGRHWLLMKKPDGAATPGRDGEFDAGSILSGLTVEELEEGKSRLRSARIHERLAGLGTRRGEVKLSEVEVMLAEPATAAFDDDRWVFELKYDGYRLLAHRHDGAVHLRYRSGRDATVAFPEIIQSLLALPFERFLLDAEVVVLDDDAHPNFGRLQDRAPLTRPLDVQRGMRENPVVLYAFDLLAFGDFDLRLLPLVERKSCLRELIPKSGVVRYADHVPGRGTALLLEVQRRGVEGVMAKRSDSPYVAGRSALWHKIRVEHTDDLVIAGFTEARGNRRGFRGLTLGAYDGDRLVYVGRAGSGFSDDELDRIHAELLARVCEKPEIAQVPTEPNQVWVRPELVAEINYKNLTRDKVLRAPVFVRLRPDKSPRECTLPLSGDRPDEQPARVKFESREAVEPLEKPEKPAGPRVVISNPDKVFWPEEGYTKADLVAYYREASPWLLPYLRDRPMTLTRYPDGIEGKSFFQKNAPPYVPSWVRTQVLWNDEARREIEYFVCDDEDALVYVANMASIPLHVRAARLSSDQQPDWCILDLDPKGAPFHDVIAIARFIHELADDIGLPNFCKTSGSSGLHVLMPLSGQMTYDQCKNFARVLAQIVAEELRDIATIERHVPKRQGKVYVDFLQNGHGRLLVSPLCVRPLPGAPVSTPIAWDEVRDGLSPRDFTIRTVPHRLRTQGDVLAPLLRERPNLASVLERLHARL